MAAPLTSFLPGRAGVGGRGLVGSEAGRAAEDGRIAGRKEQLHSPRPGLAPPPRSRERQEILDEPQEDTASWPKTGFLTNDVTMNKMLYNGE